MTVMQWGNSEGIKGRCDDKCHTATSPICECMCGGRYHGSRLNGTFERTREEHGREILETAKRRAEAEGFAFEEFPDQPRLI